MVSAQHFINEAPDAHTVSALCCTIFVLSYLSYVVASLKI